MTTDGNNEKHARDEHPGYVEIAGRRIELSGTSGRSTFPEASTAIPIRADRTTGGRRDEHPDYVEIAGQRIELSGTSGRSTFPQASAALPIRADRTTTGIRTEISGPPDHGTPPRAEAQPVTRDR